MYSTKRNTSFLNFLLSNFVHLILWTPIKHIGVYAAIRWYDRTTVRPYGVYDSTVVQLYGKILIMYLNCLGKKRDMVNTFMSKKTFHFGQRCVCECANYTPKNAHVRMRACACAIGILAKRTRACDVRAAENQVCKCARQKSVALSLLICIVNQC